MIVYETGILSTLGRVHGSAVYKTVLPATFSTSMLLVYFTYLPEGKERKVVQHPYAVGAFIAFFSFLLTFRLNYGYQRYWEGATAVHTMMSKWLDCAMVLGAFHYQSTQYDDIRPLASGTMGPHEEPSNRRKTPILSSMLQAAQIADLFLRQEEEEQQQHQMYLQQQQRRRLWWRSANNTITRNSSVSSFASSSSATSSVNSSGIHVNNGGGGSLRGVPGHPYNDVTTPVKTKKSNKIHKSASSESLATRFHREELAHQKKQLINRTGRNYTTALRKKKIPIPLRFQQQFTGGDSGPAEKQPQLQQPQDDSRIPVPSLFLQEMAHLLSLMTAVALSTLRNDVEFAESPVVEYFPGQPWPPVDPDCLEGSILQQYSAGSPVTRGIQFMLGLERSPQFRTLYNAARPFAVLGGVSDEEIRLLQTARGPTAKVNLVAMWVQEFTVRESLAGSTGRVHGAIVSRVFQCFSDGMSGYQQARKIAYIPFPFPHGQMNVFFGVIVVLVMPALLGGHINNLWFALAMNWITILCFLGGLEVARELETAFSSAPNDLPLTTFQAEFNEALVTVYAGFHPDAWWEPTKNKKSTRNLRADTKDDGADDKEEHDGMNSVRTQ